VLVRNFLDRERNHKDTKKNKIFVSFVSLWLLNCSVVASLAEALCRSQNDRLGGRPRSGWRFPSYERPALRRGYGNLFFFGNDYEVV
jgi:hypothetical protein